MKNNESIFKVGDRVFDFNFGWGVVSSIDTTSEYPIWVTFGNNNQMFSYTFNGNVQMSLKPSLSFTEYKLNGFSQQRPEILPNKGDIVWVRDSEDAD